MDAIYALLATLLIVHALEGGFWVRRTALVFVQRRRGWTRVETRSPVGDGESVFVFASPTPPIPAMIVVDPWPVLFDDKAIYNVPLTTLEADESRLPTFEALGPERAKRAVAEGKDIYVGRTRFVRASSSVLAHEIAELMHEWAELSESDRPKLNARRRKRHNEAWIRERLALHASTTQWLRPLANVIPVLLLASLAGVLLVQRVYLMWPWVLATNVAVLAAIWIGFFKAHRKIHPERRASRWYQLMLFVIAPLSAARAHAWLARDLLAGADPLDVARVLQSEPELAETAGEIWRDVKHPIGLAAFASVPRETLDRERSALEAHAKAALKAAGLSVSALETPPPREPPSFDAYCPRCRAVFADASGDCSDCPGVARRMFVDAA